MFARLFYCLFHPFLTPFHPVPALFPQSASVASLSIALVSIADRRHVHLGAWPMGLILHVVACGFLALRVKFPTFDPW